MDYSVLIFFLGNQWTSVNPKKSGSAWKHILLELKQCEKINIITDDRKKDLLPAILTAKLNALSNAARYMIKNMNFCIKQIKYI